MQDPDLSQNVKYQAIEAHATQTAFGGFIRFFANRDEIFWAETFGAP